MKRYTMDDFHEGQMVTIRDVDALGLEQEHPYGIIDWIYNDKPQTVGLTGTIMDQCTHDGTLDVYIKTSSSAYRYWYLPNWLRPVTDIEETTQEADDELFW